MSVIAARQIGTGNKLDVNQTDDANRALGEQVGMGNGTQIVQSGSDNAITFRQDGNFNSLDYSQLGQSIGTVIQQGRGLALSLNQGAGAAPISIVQTGAGR